MSEVTRDYKVISILLLCAIFFLQEQRWYFIKNILIVYLLD